MITRSAAETTAAGRAFAQRLRPGDLALLEGPLGSGKTTFVQGIAEGLGADVPATSPSFVIVNEYNLGRRSPTSDVRHPATVLRHVDLCRLPDPTVDLDRIGLPELLADPSAIAVVEWADRIPAEALRGGGSARRRIFRVRFRHGQSEHERTLDVGE